MLKKIKFYLKLMRVHHWVKNLFIFLPLFFSFQFKDISLLIANVWSFIGFSFLASAIYIINDWCDHEDDKLHPEKRHRPIASGAVTSKEAFVLLVILFMLCIVVYAGVLKNMKALYLVMGYFILNILYSIKLKRIPIIDISIVAIGFVIRVFIGGIVIDTPLSQWLIIMTFLLALLLALGKRRDDVIIYEKTGNKTRKSIDGYNLSFTNAGITIITAVILIAYIMYTMSDEIIMRNGDNLYLTSVFVIIGLLRYLLIIFVDEKSGSPTMILFKDHFLHIIILMWLMSFLLLSLYYK